MSDEPVDLTALHAPVDTLTAAIAARCAPLLAARRAHVTTVQIARWWRPALAASLLVAAGAALLLALPFQRSDQATRGTLGAHRAPAPRVQLAEAVGIPRALARHLTSRTPPRLSDLLETRR